MQSTSFSTQMDYLVPEGKIATLPQGYMVGQVADNFDQQVSQKNFNCLIDVDADKMEREERSYNEIPDVYHFDDLDELLENNRNQICNDVMNILIESTTESDD